MPRHFPGLLSNPIEPASGLRVTLILWGDVIEIKSDEMSLGLWRCAEMDAARSNGNWFRLNIDDETWRFLPDAPTEFLFFAFPRITGGATPRRSWRDRIDIGSLELISLGRITLGAVLAVFLLSIGMLVGRYRLDDSSVAVFAVLFAGAGLGAWWTYLQGRQGRDEEARTPKRPSVLPPHRERSALSVQEVIATTQPIKSERGDDKEKSGFEGPTLIPTRPPLDETTSNAEVVVEAVAEGSPDHGSNEANSWADTDQRPESRDDPEPTDDEQTGAVESSEEPTEEQIEIEEQIEEQIEIQVAAFESPDSASSSQRTTPEPLVTPRLGGDEETVPDEPTSSLDPSISIAELLDETADIAKPAKIVKTPARPADESPIELTAVRGIGPALSAKLSELGVTDVRELAMLDSDDLAYVEQRLGRFASGNRARRWVTEAQRIVAEQDRHRSD